MGNKSSNTNYDILDKILSDAGIRDASTGRVWVVPDPRYPDRGFWSDNTESVGRIKQQVDDIERYLRS